MLSLMLIGTDRQPNSLVVKRFALHGIDSIDSGSILHYERVCVCVLNLIQIFVYPQHILSHCKVCICSVSSVGGSCL